MKHAARRARILMLLTTAAFCLGFLAPVRAQCINTESPTCDVYKNCFAKYCPCSVEEYFVSYGEKYCKRFLSIAAFSVAGKQWRDATLKCLQEEIVPKLNIQDNPTCNCSQMKAFAFDSHVRCYTNPVMSMCDLPMADVIEIYKTIDTIDILDSSGWRQMRESAAICKERAPDDGRRTFWSTVHFVLSTK